jgi:hypothetical protein
MCHIETGFTGNASLEARNAGKLGIQAALV